MLGVAPGAVTPFGVINDTRARVNVVLDAGLMRARHPQLPSAGQHHDDLNLAREDLVKFLEATGHSPRIEPVAGVTARRTTDRIAFRAANDPFSRGFSRVPARTGLQNGGTGHMLRGCAGFGAARPTDSIKDTTTATFMKDVIEESKRQPVLVDFWAPMVRPVQAAHAGDREGRARRPRARSSSSRWTSTSIRQFPGRWASSRSRR